MPLGNLTSQFFANVYLNELDQFVKKQLKAIFSIGRKKKTVSLDDVPLDEIEMPFHKW